MSRLPAVALAAMLIAAAFPCRAAPTDDATKAAARKIAQEGLTLYDGGKYEEALDHFLQADAMVHAPTMLLMAARSLGKLGRLVEAADRYAAASQTLLDAQASDAFRQAVVDATKEREALMTRIPSIVITVDAPAGADKAVTLDGAALSAATLGQKHLLDPGAHTIEARSGDVTTRTRIELREGESRTVHLDLTTSAAGPLRPVGWAAIGVGAAGLVIGAVTGGLAIAKNDELVAAGCKDGVCPASAESTLKDYDTLKIVSGTGLVGGLALLAGGVILVAVAPSSKPAATGARRPAPPRVTPFVGLGGVGVKGVF